MKPSQSILVIFTATSTAIRFGQSSGVSVRGLHRVTNGKGWSRLSTDGQTIQAVDKAGRVVDEMAISPEQAAKLERQHEMAVAQALEVKNGTTPGKIVERQGCATWASMCDEDFDCYVYNCDFCFKINAVGVCYGFD